uniref:mRNA interferase HigB n=1 Tax=Candidatus Kentrum sp. TC TaxID=2126339 RepID=A0A450ZTD4_9GAMM|nr:MAG: mRNA interferase HigB [Candidatus Kentron sp. TC]
MHVISKRPFFDAAKAYPNHKILDENRFDFPHEMRRFFPSLDNFSYRDKWWVIDVAGNRLRVIAFIQFPRHFLYVKHIVTHAGYDRLRNRCARGDWKW